MKKYEEFDNLFEILHKSYIAQYQEFDDTGHCYYSVEHTVSWKNDEGVKPSLHLLDAKSGKVVHTIQEEVDFDYITVNELERIVEVDIHLKSNYQYVFYAKKL